MALDWRNQWNLCACGDPAIYHAGLLGSAKEGTGHCKMRGCECTAFVPRSAKQKRADWRKSAIRTRNQLLTDYYSAEYANSPKGRKILRWKAAAIADGWKRKLVRYAGRMMYPESLVCDLDKGGFSASIHTSNLPYSIALYGPDKLAVHCPFPYSWEQLNKNLHICCVCKKKDITAVKLNSLWVPRVCAKCGPAEIARLQREQQEQIDWVYRSEHARRMGMMFCHSM